MKYIKLAVIAKSEKTEIWLADDEGNLVQKETGKLKTEILPGTYNIHFGLGADPIKVVLSDKNKVVYQK